MNAKPDAMLPYLFRQIWMPLQNDTQFPAEEKQTVRVFFKQGKAIEIEKQGKSK